MSDLGSLNAVSGGPFDFVADTFSEIPDTFVINLGQRVYIKELSDTYYGDGNTPWSILGGAISRNSAKLNTIVLLGNSRLARGQDGTTLGATTVGTYTVSSVFGWANARSGNRFIVLNSDGIGGTNLDQFAQRWPTTVKPFNPAWVFIQDHVNDVYPGHTFEQVVASYMTLIGLNASIGAKTILTTSGPYNTAPEASKQLVNRVNRWIMALQDPRVVAVDLAAGLCDPITGLYSTAYSDDGLHQNAYGAFKMAKQLSSVLTNLVPQRSPFPSSPTDESQLLLNPWLTGTLGVSQLPTNWTTSGTPSTSYSLVARTDGVPGNLFEINNTASSAFTFLTQLAKPLAASTIGKRYRYMIEIFPVTITFLADLSASIQIRNSSSTTILTSGAISKWYTQNGPDSDLNGETLLCVSPAFTMPVGAASYYVYNYATFQGILRFGRCALVEV